DDAEDQAEHASHLEATLAVLEGRAAPAAIALAAPRADWRLGYLCGTAAMALHMQMTTLPNRAVAWRALNQPRLALDAFIDEFWVASLDVGAAPPELASLAEAAFGQGSYAAEMERGIDGLTIEYGAGGGHAWLHAFGRRLPVPLGGHEADPRAPA